MGWGAILSLDSCTQREINHVAQLGSNWNNTLNAGSFYWNLNNSVGNRNRNISSHSVNAKEQ